MRLVAPALRHGTLDRSRYLEGRVANTPKDADSIAVKQALAVADTAI